MIYGGTREGDLPWQLERRTTEIKLHLGSVSLKPVPTPFPKPGTHMCTYGPVHVGTREQVAGVGLGEWERDKREGKAGPCARNGQLVPVPGAACGSDAPAAPRARG